MARLRGRAPYEGWYPTDAKKSSASGDTSSLMSLPLAYSRFCTSAMRMLTMDLTCALESLL
jgi:hypothetical protein